jgi:hypothetical protein
MSDVTKIPDEQLLDKFTFSAYGDYQEYRAELLRRLSRSQDGPQVSPCLWCGGSHDACEDTPLLKKNITDFVKLSNAAAAQDGVDVKGLARQSVEIAVDMTISDPAYRIAQLWRSALSSAPAPPQTELRKAVARWVEAKRQEVLREDLKGDLQHEVRRQEREVEEAITEELKAEYGHGRNDAKDQGIGAINPARRTEIASAYSPHHAISGRAGQTKEHAEPLTSTSAPATKVEAAPTPIDGKFGILGDRIVNLVSREPIPEDEPLFLLRARDHHALAVLSAYQQIAAADCNELHLAGIQQVMDKFTRFAAEHPERMKQPGITRHLKLAPLEGWRKVEPNMVVVRREDLESIERKGHNQVCPVCHISRFNGHKNTCWLKHALMGWPSPPSSPLEATEGK